MTQIPVKGKVLKWAREFRGLSQEAAAERLGLSASELQEYEEEKRVPTLSLFESFAAKYRLPQATLFLDSPPKIPAPPTDFRSVGGRKALRHSFEFENALSNVRTFLFHYSRIAAEDEEFTTPRLPALSMDDDPDTLGERERRRFNISPDQQLAWSSKDAFGNWRAILEDRGVLVFQQKFPLDDCRGLSIFEDENAPCIVVNKAETVDVAKTFTLWHEYCHLLLRKPGVSDQNFRNTTEVFCNRFAASFLIPRAALRQLLPRWPNEPVDWSQEDVARSSRRLKVSQRALAIRLEQLNLAPHGFAQKFEWSGQTPRKRQSSGGNYIATRLSEIGAAYTGRLLGAMDRGVIDSVQVVEATRISDDGLDSARAYVNRKREVASAG